MKSTLSFSIIMVCLNAVKTIEKSIQSVLSQTYDDRELVIIDGASRDGTVQIIRKFADQIGFFVSEPDNGIYHAMNKGIAAATGDILFFLNADDYLADKYVIEEAARQFQRHPETELLFGNQLWDREGRMDLVDQGSPITRVRLARRTIQHQTVFARRTLFDRVGGFDDQLRVVSDYEWLLRVFSKGDFPYRHINMIVTVMTTKGLSWTGNFEEERRKVMKEYYSPAEIFFFRTIPVRIEALWYQVVAGYWTLRDHASKFVEHIRRPR